jgi:hypothetical protein
MTSPTSPANTHVARIPADPHERAEMLAAHREMVERALAHDPSYVPAHPPQHGPDILDLINQRVSGITTHPSRHFRAIFVHAQRAQAQACAYDARLVDTIPAESLLRIGMFGDAPDLIDVALDRLERDVDRPREDRLTLTIRAVIMEPNPHTGRVAAHTRRLMAGQTGVISKLVPVEPYRTCDPAFVTTDVAWVLGSLWPACASPRDQVRYTKRLATALPDGVRGTYVAQAIRAATDFNFAPQSPWESGLATTLLATCTTPSEELVTFLSEAVAQGYQSASVWLGAHVAT